MSKAVLLSVAPKWCELIASGRKTIEVRKTKPKIETPFKCYIYCTMDNAAYNPRKYLWKEDKTGRLREIYWNGKVIGEFVCDYVMRHCNMQNADIAEQQSLVKRESLFEYSNGKELFGWHISDLVIYDKPKELSEFNGRKLVWRGNNHIHAYEQMKRPPQSWCYVEVVSE